MPFVLCNFINMITWFFFFFFCSFWFSFVLNCSNGHSVKTMMKQRRIKKVIVKKKKQCHEAKSTSGEHGDSPGSGEMAPWVPLRLQDAAVQWITRCMAGRNIMYTINVLHSKAVWTRLTLRCPKYRESDRRRRGGGGGGRGEGSIWTRRRG